MCVRLEQPHFHVYICICNCDDKKTLLMVNYENVSILARTAYVGVYLQVRYTVMQQTLRLLNLVIKL